MINIIYINYIYNHILFLKNILFAIRKENYILKFKNRT